MSFSDDATSLERSLRVTHDAMLALRQGLQVRRAHWISARPSLLAPAPDLEQLTLQIAREEATREELLARLRRALPAVPGQDSNRLHINVTRIAAALPEPAARSLRDIADAVQRLARDIRAEVTLGQRLLRFARDIRPGAGSEPRGHGGAPGYDRGAKFVRVERTAGTFVDGRM